MTGQDARKIFYDAQNIKSIDTVYLEGGEPFIVYETMKDIIQEAYSAGLKTGIITNCSWAAEARDAFLKLAPIGRFLTEAIYSCDEYHNNYQFVKHAIEAAKELNINFRINAIGGKTSPLRHAGRALEALGRNQPKKIWSEFTKCAYYDVTYPEDAKAGLENPLSVHIDPYGYAQVCQGICIGNVFEKPMSLLVNEYEPFSHPIISPILRGGPAELAKDFGLSEGEFVDACGLCYSVRKKLLGRFPKILAPLEIYGEN